MFKRFRHAQMLAALSLLLLANPFVEGIRTFTIVDLLLLLTLISAVVACAHRRSQVVVGLGLIAVVQGVSLYRSLHRIESVTAMYSALTLALLGYITALVLLDVFRAREVSSDTICGALSAYLLLGLSWAFAYALLESLLPGSILGLRPAEGFNGYDTYVGFSFFTLTTVGYGNVVPNNDKADVLASAEAIVGQIYLTVLVARLVAINLTTSHLPRVIGSDED